MRKNVNVTHSGLIFMEEDLINARFIFQNRKNCFSVLKLKEFTYLQ